MKIGTKIGAKIAHFGITAGQDEVEQHDHQDEQTSSGSARNRRSLQQLGECDGDDLGRLV